MDRDFEIVQRDEEVVLLLGSNIGDKRANLQDAIARLSQVFGAPVALSTMHETPPWGKLDQDSFLNMAAVFTTNQKPLILLETVLDIERELGRVRQEKWGPRLIDIDIIFFGNLVYQSDILEIPHPYMQDRMFVLDPLIEVVPYYRHPLLDKTVRELRREMQAKEELNG